MKKILTNNIGLKLMSVFCAFILWIVVVNIDDPVISRVYSGIPVEIINASAITDENKTYEVADGSDVISVSISAERSIIESLTKDNIKATADMKNLTFMNTVPIEVKTNRYSEKIGSISTRNTSLSVVIEDKKTKQLKLTINTDGKVAKGYIAGDVVPVVDVIKVSGPESKVNNVEKAIISIDYADMNESFTTSCPVTITDIDGNVVDDPTLTISKTEIRASVEILETKEIPVTASFTGTPSYGYGATGTVICEPSSIVIAGKGTAFDNLSSVKISDDVLIIDGATQNVTNSVNIKDYLPKGVTLADSSFDGNVDVVAVIEAHDSTVVEVPVSNISVINLPENYSAHIVSGEENIRVDVSGLQEDLQTISQSTVSAQIDALTLTPRIGEGEDVDTQTTVHTGSNDGSVILNLPSGVVQTSNISLEVVINYHDADNTDAESSDTESSETESTSSESKKSDN